uniref:Poly(A) RNA polymerase mitochondrial-like central palm domain-containing protein n=1 Tax=Clastoptera arizonana TaxID=38151 RepID=A0A1B6D7W1_9HEMI
MLRTMITLNKRVQKGLNEVKLTEAKDFRKDGKGRIDILLKNLQMCLKDFNYTYYPFGSRTHSLGFDDSDLDIFIDTGGMYDGSKRQERHIQNEIIMDIVNYIRSEPEMFNVIACIVDAKVPLIRLIYQPENIRCDLTFLNGISVEKKYLVRRYLNMDKRVKWAVIAVKVWAKDHNLIGQKGFNSYALFWMTVFVMMLSETLIPVAHLYQLYTGPKKKVIAWECGFCQGEIKDIPKSQNVKTVVDFLFDFFNYYKSSPEDPPLFSVTCPLVGREVDGEKFRTLKLSPAFKSYVDYVKAGGSGMEPFKLDSALRVQDPLELSDNLTKWVSKEKVANFELQCYKDAQRLQFVMAMEDKKL